MQRASSTNLPSAPIAIFCVAGFSSSRPFSKYCTRIGTPLIVSVSSAEIGPPSRQWPLMLL